MEHMKKQTRRVQLELPDRSMQKLESLKDQTDAASYAEVIRNAVMAYSWMIERYENDEQLLVRDSSGNTREVELFTAH